MGKFFAFFMLLPALGSIYFGVKYFNESRALVKTGVMANARVVDMLETYDIDDGTIYKSIFECIDGPNVGMRVQNIHTSVIRMHEIGDEVEIVYYRNSQTGSETSFWKLYFHAIAFSLAGCVLLFWAIRDLISEFLSEES